MFSHIMIGVFAHPADWGGDCGGGDCGGGDFDGALARIEAGYVAASGSGRSSRVMRMD
jgi:hypothetical protein